MSHAFCLQQRLVNDLEKDRQLYEHAPLLIVQPLCDNHRIYIARKKPERYKLPRGRTQFMQYDKKEEQERSYRKQIARQLCTQYVEGIYGNPVT